MTPSNADGISDRWALITGASSGIGRRTAQHLAELGANLVLADIAIVALEELGHELSASGCKIRPLALDVSNFHQVSENISHASREIGAFDFLVNSAGVAGTGPVEKLLPDEIDRVFRVNTFGAFYVCRAVLPGMMAARRGSIVNVSSLHAQNGQANAAHYAASKGAIIGLTKSLAREKASFGIRANAVAPGPIDTPLWRTTIEHLGLNVENFIAERSRSIPLQRLGSPTEVASVIVFLAGPWSSYVTGQVIPVGGGEIMR